VKLLFDESISPRLVPALAKIFPGSIHVREVGLTRADDGAIWSYARDHGFAIVSKDSDFRQRSFAFGHPPKVISLLVGNCSTAEIESLLRKSREDLEAFALSNSESFLLLR
jgi:predicted nuclease of predicted toxin-antitoxin system